MTINPPASGMISHRSNVVQLSGRLSNTNVNEIAILRLKDFQIGYSVTFSNQTSLLLKPEVLSIRKRLFGQILILVPFHVVGRYVQWTTTCFSSCICSRCLALSSTAPWVIGFFTLLVYLVIFHGSKKLESSSLKLLSGFYSKPD